MSKSEVSTDGSEDPVVEAITRNIMKRANKLPEMFLGRLMTGSFDTPVPAPGAGRENWVRSHVADAFAPSRSSEIVDVLSQRAPGIGKAVENTVRDGAVAWFEKATNGTVMGRDLPSMVDTVRSYTANRVVDFLKPGKRLAMRVSREASTLRQAKDETVLDRFSDAPQSRLDPLPSSGRERTDWIRERLLAEYVSARGGVMAPEAVVAAAGRARGPVPTHDLSEMPFVQEGERSMVRSRVREDMAREAGMSDPVLRSRHAGVPGIDVMEIPQAGKARMQAIGHILMAELVRGEMKRQQMIVPPKKEKAIPKEAQTMVRYAPRSRGLGKIEREIVDARPPAAPPPKEKAAVPMGGDRVSAARRYSDMVRKATGSHDF